MNSKLQNPTSIDSLIHERYTKHMICLERIDESFQKSRLLLLRQISKANQAEDLIKYLNVCSKMNFIPRKETPCCLELKRYRWDTDDLDCLVLKTETVLLQTKALVDSTLCVLREIDHVMQYSLISLISFEEILVQQKSNFFCIELSGKLQKKKRALSLASSWIRRVSRLDTLYLYQIGKVKSVKTQNSLLERFSLKRNRKRSIPYEKLLCKRRESSDTDLFQLSYRHQNLARLHQHLSKNHQLGNEISKFDKNNHSNSKRLQVKDKLETK